MDTRMLLLYPEVLVSRYSRITISRATHQFNSDISQPNSANKSDWNPIFVRKGEYSAKKQARKGWIDYLLGDQSPHTIHGDAAYYNEGVY